MLNQIITLRQSTLIRPSKNGCSSDKAEQMIRVCTRNCHVTTDYLDILQLFEDSHSEFDIIGIYGTFMSQDQSLSAYSFPGYHLEVMSRV